MTVILESLKLAAGFIWVKAVRVLQNDLLD